MTHEEAVGRMLVEEGYITDDQLRSSLKRQESSFGKSFGEVIVESGFVSEGAFLRTLAKYHNTQYVTKRKLSKVSVPQSVLDKVPEALADKYNVCPIQFRDGLTIVLGDPANVAAIDELKFVSGISTIRPLVALDSTVRCAINKFYKGDSNAFGFGIDVGDEDEDMGLTGFTRQIQFADAEGTNSSSATQEGKLVIHEEPPLAVPSEAEEGGLNFGASSEPTHVMDVPTAAPPSPGPKPPSGPHRSKEPIHPTSQDDGIFLGGLEEMPGDNNIARDVDAADSAADPFAQASPERPVGESTPGGPAPSTKTSTGPAPQPAGGKRPGTADAPKRHRRMLVVEHHDQVRKFLVKLFKREGFNVEGVKTRDDALKALTTEQFDALVIKERDVGESVKFEEKVKAHAPNLELSIIHGYGSAVMGDTLSYHKLMDSYTGTLDVVIGMLEMDRGSFQGHTHTVAKYVKLISRKLGLSQHETDEAVLAAYIHDLGKKSLAHLTLLDVAEGVSAENLEEARSIPLRLLASVNFPMKVGPVLDSLFDRFDGRGNITGLKGDDIPIGARIMAAVEAFEHLRTVGLTPDGPPVESADAMTLLNGKSGALFDPRVVETLLQVVKDDLFLGTMDSAREHILIVDDEVELGTLLELKCVNEGYRVSVAKTAEEGLAKIQQDMPDLVITEVTLAGGDGFAFIENMQAAGCDAPFLFLSHKADSASVTKGLDLGAEDYITKPANVELVFAKIKRLFGRIISERTSERTSGVSGSLSEMDIPSIIQILGAGTKTGVVELVTNGQRGTIMIEQGRIVNAELGDLVGEEAFYQLLKWSEGSFAISPNVEITERLINKPNDSLLLEGFRRLDEENRDGGDPIDDITLDGTDFF